MALIDDKNLDLEGKKNDIIDINIEGIKRTRFRINGDPQAILELNLSDMGIVRRLEVGLEKLQAEMSKIAEIPDGDDALSDKLLEADKHMREYVDYIFDFPVSSVCAKSGTMYDPFNGVFRYEHIIDSLTKLYEENINVEYKKINARIQKHTEKYTSKKSTTKRSRK